jgi:hypothetical protein
MMDRVQLSAPTGEALIREHVAEWVRITAAAGPAAGSAYLQAARERSMRTLSRRAERFETVCGAAGMSCRPR